MMEQNDSENKEPETDFDRFVRETALAVDAGIDPEDRDAVRSCFMGHVQDTVREYGRLKDIAGSLERDPRLNYFVELLLRGNDPEKALSEAGLEEILRQSVEAGVPGGDEAQEQRFCEEIRDFYRGREKEEVERFVVFAGNFIDRIYREPVGRETLETIWKAFAYESDVEKAHERGMIEGQNRKIEALRRERNNTDGTGPSFGGAVAPAHERMGYIERLMRH